MLKKDIRADKSGVESFRINLRTTLEFELGQGHVAIGIHKGNINSLAQLIISVVLMVAMILALTATI